MSLQTLFKEFVTVFGSGDYTRAVTLLPAIKAEYAKSGLLLPSRGKFEEADLLAARHLLEMGVLAAIHAGDSSQSIVRLISQVRPFYSPFLKLTRSENETKVVALYLLLLLTNNEIAEFHTELHSLDGVEVDRYLSYPLLLERWLMEGAYDKAWQAVTQESQAPAPEFAILAKFMRSTIQREIAQCAERAYTSLPIANARHLLFFDTDQQLLTLAHQRGWIIENTRVVFTKSNDDHEEETNNGTLVANLLEYATQIETII